jgi:hypothetical protein
MSFTIKMVKTVRVRGQHTLRKGEILAAEMGVDDYEKPIWLIHMNGMLSELPAEDAELVETPALAAVDEVDLDVEEMIRSVNPYANNPNYGRF